MTLASRVGAFLVAIAIPLGASAQSVPPTAERYYGQALENMRALPPTGNVSYTVNVQTQGATFTVAADDVRNAQVTWVIGRGGKHSSWFQAVNRSSDHRTAMLTDSGWAIALSPIFNPTWSGIDDWIRYGVYGRPAGLRLVTPAPNATPGDLRTLVTVRAMGVAYYNVYDAGTEACENGDVGYAVRLAARGDTVEHPLTGAVIDGKTQQICTIRLAIRKDGGPLSYKAELALHVELVGGASVVTSEHIEFNVFLFDSPSKQIESDITYTNITFPITLPEAELAP